MTDIGDRDMDGGGAPGINGGLLDPRTFPSPWPPAPTPEPQAAPPSPDQNVHAQVLQDILDAQAKLPPTRSQMADDAGGYDGHELQRPPPAITGPLDADTHAEVLKDILNAQAKLPPLRRPVVGDGGLRHIDPYPGMNRTPRGGNPPLTQQAAADFLNGVPLPKDAFGPHVTFINDEGGKPSPDLPVTNGTANMVEQAIMDSGVKSVNINSTVGGRHALDAKHRSRHYDHAAIDENSVNGAHVGPGNPASTSLQNAFARQSNIMENYGPASQTRVWRRGGLAQPVLSVAEDHEGHDHFSGWD